MYLFQLAADIRAFRFFFVDAKKKHLHGAFWQCENVRQFDPTMGKEIGNVHECENDKHTKKQKDWKKDEMSVKW